MSYFGEKAGTHTTHARIRSAHTHTNNQHTYIPHELQEFPKSPSEKVNLYFGVLFLISVRIAIYILVDQVFFLIRV